MLSALGGYHESACNGERRNDLLTDRPDSRASRLPTGEVSASGAKSCTTAAAIQPFRRREKAFGRGFSGRARERPPKPLTADAGDSIPDDITMDFYGRRVESIYRSDIA